MPSRSHRTHPAMDLYISHTTKSNGGIKWFIVDGTEQPLQLRRGSINEQVQQLLEDERTIYHIRAKPRLTRGIREVIRLQPSGRRRKQEEVKRGTA